MSEDANSEASSVLEAALGGKDRSRGCPVCGGVKGHFLACSFGLDTGLKTGPDRHPTLSHKEFIQIYCRDPRFHATYRAGGKDVRQAMEQAVVATLRRFGTGTVEVPESCLSWYLHEGRLLKYEARHEDEDGDYTCPACDPQPIDRSGEETGWRCGECGWTGRCRDLSRTADGLDPACPTCGSDDLTRPEDWSEQVDDIFSTAAPDPDDGDEGGKREALTDATLVTVGDVTLPMAVVRGLEDLLQTHPDDQIRGGTVMRQARRSIVRTMQPVADPQPADRSGEECRSAKESAWHLALRHEGLSGHPICPLYDDGDQVGYECADPECDWTYSWRAPDPDDGDEALATLSTEQLADIAEEREPCEPLGYTWREIRGEIARRLRRAEKDFQECFAAMQAWKQAHDDLRDRLRRSTPDDGVREVDPGLLMTLDRWGQRFMRQGVDAVRSQRDAINVTNLLDRLRDALDPEEE